MPDNNTSELPVIEIKKSTKTDITKGYQALGRKYFPILSQLEDVQLYRIHKSEILSAAQKAVLKYALSPKKLEKAGFLQLIQGFEILNKAERLENNQSTENVSSSIFGKVRVEHILTDNAEILSEK